MVQWLGYNKELKRLVVETTANQVCRIYGSQRNAKHFTQGPSYMFLSVYRTFGHLQGAITWKFGSLHVHGLLDWILNWVCEFVIVDSYHKNCLESPGHPVFKGPRSFAWNWCLGARLLPAGKICFLFLHIFDNKNLLLSSSRVLKKHVLMWCNWLHSYCNCSTLNLSNLQFLNWWLPVQEREAWLSEKHLESC